MIEEIKYNDKAEWLKLRRSYLGGSDAGAVAGMNPYKSAYGVWAEKTGLTPEFEGNLTTEIGLYLEDLVAQIFMRETGKRVRRKNRLLVNDAYPFACANIDRILIGERAGLEIKTTNSIPLIRTLRNNDEFPDAYYAQCLHYIAVTGLDRWYLAVLINCREFRTFVLERDEAEIDALMDIERRFWRHVEKKEPPAVDGSDDCSAALNTIYSTGDDEELDLSALLPQLELYSTISDKMKMLKRDRDACENEIKSFLKNASYGRAEGYKVSWTNSTRSTFDKSAFLAAHPGMDLSPYYKTTTGRTLRIMAKGDK